MINLFFNVTDVQWIRFTTMDRFYKLMTVMLQKKKEKKKNELFYLRDVKKPRFMLVIF